MMIMSTVPAIPIANDLHLLILESGVEKRRKPKRTIKKIYARYPLLLCIPRESRRKRVTGAIDSSEGTNECQSFKLNSYLSNIRSIEALPLKTILEKLQLRRI